MRAIVVKILNILAKNILAKYKPAVIGITGSTGKSSTQKAVYEILKKKYKVRCNYGACGTDISIPLSIIGLESGGRSVKKWARIIIKALKLLAKRAEYPDILILEMGVDRPNDMKKMLEVVKPDIGILTGVGKFPARIRYFRNAKHITREKFLLVKSLSKKDLAALNYDDEFIRESSENTRAKIISYGFGKDCILRAEEIFLSGRKWKAENGIAGISFKISYQGTTVPFRFPSVLGRGQIYATLAAVAIGLRFGFNLVEMSEIISKFQALPGRMKLMNGIKKSLIIDDSFNSNPNSALAALEALRKLDAPRKIAVLGDMLELGEYCESARREIGKQASKSADLLFTYGSSRSKVIFQQAQDSGMEKDKTFHFEDVNSLIKSLKEIIKSGDIVLIKGLRAMRMERIVEEIMAEPKLANELLVK